MHVAIPLSIPFYVMGAISKESIWRSDAQLAAKWPHVEFTSTNVALLLDPLLHLLLLLFLE